MPIRTSSLSRNIALLVGSVMLFVACAIAMTYIVGFRPYGVPVNRLDDWDEIQAELQMKRELLADPEKQARPIAFVKFPKHEFGMLDPHTTATHKFVVTNKGSDPLALEVLDTSCKCTTGDLVDGLVKPGESTEVTLTWNTGYEADRYEQTATLKTNDPIQEEITLTVSGTVRNELTVPSRVSFPASDPAQQTKRDFFVHSQLWKSFEVTDIRASKDLKEFGWFAEPTSPDVSELGNANARSAWKVTVETTALEYGKFAGEIEVDILPGDGGEKITKTIDVSGRVRAAISFMGPELHPKFGFELGTVNAGKELKYFFSVRARDPNAPDLEVLDIEPKELKATLEKTSRKGIYRLTVVIPKDCPTTIFNRDQRGYVHVGDPQNPEYMNWFPMSGTVVDLAK